MRPSTLHFLFGLAIVCLISLPPQAHAKPVKGKAEKAAPQAEKEKVILLPLVISDEAQNMSSEMQAAVVQGLQQKYLVYSGDRVLQELKKASDKQNHSAKHECDQTRCLQDIATAFQTENVAVVHINKIEGGYLLSVSIKGVISDEAVFDNSLPCEGCNAFKVVEKLKELSGTVAPVVAAAPAETPQAKVNQNDPDAVLWAEAQKGNTVDDYQVYLDTYPKGKYAPFAKAKSKKLKEAAQAVAEQQEQSAWDKAQHENSEDSFGLYLKGYPVGHFAELAKVRQEKLKNDVVAQEETSLWNKADSSNDKAAIESYLIKYPTGRYSSAANAKLKSMQESREANQQAKEENDLWNKADSSNSKAVLEIYLHRYPNGRYVANAKAKLNVISGENGIPKTLTQLNTNKQNESRFKDDAPSPDASVNLDAIPDAVPKAEPLHRYANRPYTALGKTYTPLEITGNFKEIGIASWYGKKFHGQRTSIGEIYNMYGMTAAHPTLPVPSYARVTNVDTKKSVIVRINDRGPFLSDRIIDLSYAAAYKLEVINVGSANVLVESIAAELDRSPLVNQR